MGNYKVAVIMGSDSDLPVMKEAVDVLKKFEIEADVKILSAHRSPEAVREYALSAKKNGIGVIIAGASGAAHLAGVVASMTTIPVIGVPIESQALKGMDSLLSIVQMPAGIPVATMAIGQAGAKNAGILAAQILSLSNPDLEKGLVSYKKELEAGVIEKNRNINSKL